MVLTSKRGALGLSSLGELLAALEMEIVPVDAPLAERAFEAWLRFGKGRHPAALNFGDCFSYALAAIRGEPLLFKGEDFSRTDLQQILHLTRT